MRISALLSALRQMSDQFRSPSTLAVLLACSVVLGISGPFDTLTSLELPLRLAYWSLIVPLTFAAGSFGSALGGKIFAGTPLLLRLLLVSLLSTLFVWTVLHFAHIALNFSFAQFSSFHTDFPVLLLISMAIEGARMVLNHTRAAEANATLPPEDPPAPRLLERLPADLRGELISLSVKDHYVSVSTTLGTHELLVRLSDAMGEVHPVQGMQVHRSHWVALAHVVRGHRSAGQSALFLSNGLRIPVSRGKQKIVEAAGLFVMPASERRPIDHARIEVPAPRGGDSAEADRGRARDDSGENFEQPAQ